MQEYFEKDRKLQKIYKEDLKITAMTARCSRIKKNRGVSFSDLLIMIFLFSMLQELIDMVYFF